MVVVTENGTGSVLFEIASHASKKWNDEAGFSDYTGTGHQIASGTNVAPLQSASISLFPTYLGADDSERRGFVGLATNAADTTVLGGIYRMSDEAEKLISSAVRIHSVDYTTGEKLVAGRFDSNTVYRSANPLATDPSVSSTSSYQRPGGTGLVVTAWAGETVVAGTSGDESAFATSNDNGKTFNDISLIDTTLDGLEDFAVNADGSKMYLVSNDGTTTATASENDLSVWRKASAWERVLSIPINDGATAYVPHVVRIAPDDDAVVYVGVKGGTNIYYSNDSGEVSWTLRAASDTIADIAVESADVLYALKADGSVRKSTNAGFIWGSAKASGLGNGYSIASLGEDKLVVGGASGGVAYSTDGNASADTWKKHTGMAGSTGNVVVAASGLAEDDYFYAGTDTVNDYIYRWKEGSSTSWSTISAQLGATEYVSGISLVGSALYALVTDTAGGSKLYRTVSPTATTVTFSTVAAVGEFYATPTALRTSTGSVVLYAIDVDVAAAEESTTDTVTDELYSYEDTLSEASPVLLAPADGSEVAMNPVTGRAFDIPFSWERVSKATKYDLYIYLDEARTQLVRSETSISSSSSTVVFILGPYTSIASGSGNTLELMPNTTYWWRVRVADDGPMESQYSDMRSFTVAEAAAVEPEPVLEVVLMAPTAGAADVPVQPTFVWSPVEGATAYEIQAAKDADFTDVWISKAGRGPLSTTVYLSEFELEYSTTYFWRVRAKVAGTWTDYAVSVFTTEARPAAPPTPEPPAPPPVIELPTPATPAYIYLIIGIGAALVIAVIILIVRTRRPV
jgi:hypothetical protein